MSKEKKTQIIMVNKSLSDDTIQIVMPPFRPISMYEIEDHYDSVVSEIESNISDKELKDHLVGFVSAFKESIDNKDVLPIAEYFMQYGANHSEPTDMIKMFELLGEFIEQASDVNRLMH